MSDRIHLEVRMNSLFKRTMLAPLFLLASRAAWAGGSGGGLPWETPLNTVAQSLTGPVALSISLIALMVAGGALVFGGELSEFARRSCVGAGDRLSGARAGFMTSLF